ncbi:thiamine pyrophosphate-dependent enzyme [Natrarchaeobius sp. A-rgal3]|uniref:thiamine pyrophosphate-dependent enzyme n=1 Tax=Natrarchaeobius versutus TaxID=1679078 RepID=UPI003510C386
MVRQTVSIDEAAEGYLKAFQLNGVDYMFGSPGSDDAPYWHYIANADSDEERISYINCRHEELAVDMAKGYAAMTGRPQIVKLHVTVGPLKAAMSIWGAHHGSLPVIILSSHLTTHENELRGGTPGTHYLDFAHPGGHENNFNRYTKWGISPENNENIGQYIARAFRIAQTAPAGPVYLNIARELSYEPRDQMDVLTHEPVAPVAPENSTLAEITSRLDAADNPAIVVGRLASHARAIEEVRPMLVDLAERLDASVFECRKWNYAFPMDHPLYLGNSHTGGHNPTNEVLPEAVDTVLVLNSIRPWYPPQEAKPDAEILMIVEDPPQQKDLYWNYPADVLAPGSPKAVLPMLLDALEAGARTEGGYKGDHRRSCADVWTQKARETSNEKPINPFWLVDRIDTIVPSDAIVVNETLSHAAIVSNLLTDRGDRTFLSAEKMNAGGLGGGLGVSLGAKLAEPDRPVVALLGDGTFNYSPVSAAFGAAQEHGLPILVVLFNNRAYQVMKPAYTNYYGEEPPQEVRISPTPDYTTQVQAWDAFGLTVDEPDEIEGALEEGLRIVREEERAALVDVRVTEDDLEFPDTSNQ